MQHVPSAPLHAARGGSVAYTVCRPGASACATHVMQHLPVCQVQLLASPVLRMQPVGYDEFDTHDLEVSILLMEHGIVNTIMKFVLFN